MAVNKKKLEIEKRGLWVPDEDLNTNLEQTMDVATKLFMKQGGLTPMIEVILQSYEEGDTSKSKAGMVFDGVDFSDRKEKAMAMYQAGKTLAEETKGEQLPVQITLMSEAWQRKTTASKKEDLDNIDIEKLDKEEVIICFTRSWDGRCGALTRRIVRDLDDKPMGTVLSMEEWVEEEAKDKSMESILLELFFTGFAVEGARHSTNTGLKDSGAYAEKSVLDAFK